MLSVECQNDSVTTEAQTLLAHMDQVARWLPKQEPHRQPLLSGIADVEQQLPHAPSRSAILSLQVHVWGLRFGPLRSLLTRRVSELGRLYGLPAARTASSC